MQWGNWRSIAREIAIIVVGVLVALGAGDLLDSWNWTRKVAQAELALHREARTNAMYAVEQVTVAPCVEAQLAAAKAGLLASGNVLEAMPAYVEPHFDYVYRLPLRPWLVSTWQASNGDGTVAHMESHRRAAYAMLYRQLDDLNVRADVIDRLSARALAMASPIALDPATRASLLGELMEQVGQSQSQSLVALQVLVKMVELGLMPPLEEIERFMATASGTASFCKAHGLPMADWQALLAERAIKPGG